MEICKPSSPTTTTQNRNHKLQSFKYNTIYSHKSSTSAILEVEVMQLCTHHKHQSIFLFKAALWTPALNAEHRQKNDINMTLTSFCQQKTICRQGFNIISNPRKQYILMNLESWRDQLFLRIHKKLIMRNKYCSTHGASFTFLQFL